MINIYIFASVGIVSLISLIGVVTLAINIDKLKKIVLLLVSFSAGALIGDVFIHLLPELVASNQLTLINSLAIIAGILIFFILEKYIHWHHCHTPHLHSHERLQPLAVTNLVGDGLHNFIDGLIIAASFFISPSVGIATTIAVILHEIPQEISDFGVLIHAGLSKGKAILFNFFSALLAIVGAGVGILFFNQVANFIPIIIAITIGGFIYIAVADLLPELNKETKLSRSLMQFVWLILGIAVMLVLLLVG